MDAAVAPVARTWDGRIRQAPVGGSVYFKYLIAWFGIVVLGLANATIRQVAYARYVSEPAGHQVSTLTFAILVGLYAWALSGFLKLSSEGEAIGVGLTWMVLTVAFEFALGRYVVGDSWRTLLYDYNVLDGRVWGLFVLWVGLAPYVFYKLHV